MVALVATIFIVVVVVLAYLSGHVHTCRTDRVSVAITSYAEYPIIGRLQQQHHIVHSSSSSLLRVTFLVIIHVLFLVIIDVSAAPFTSSPVLLSRKSKEGSKQYPFVILFLPIILVIFVVNPCPPHTQ